MAATRQRLAARQEISLDEAGALLSENEAGGKSIPAADFFRWRVEQELEEAVEHRARVLENYLEHLGAHGYATAAVERRVNSNPPGPSTPDMR